MTVAIQSIKYFSACYQDQLAISDFGVSIAILNPVDIFRRWCKLKFGLLRGHIKSLHFHFTENIYAKRYYSYFLYVFLGITGYKRQSSKILIQIYYYPLKEVRLNLDLDNSCWIQKILNLLLKNISIWFFTPNKICPRETELECIWTIQLDIINNTK